MGPPGHLVGLAAKPAAPRAPLWVLLWPKYPTCKEANERTGVWIAEEYDESSHIR